MPRFKVLFQLTVALLFGTYPMFAANYAVGTCKPNLQSYPTIFAAVSTVPSGSTVFVCPNTYAEQVVIATPLTLEGVSSGNSAQAVITVPGAGLSTISGVDFSLVAPQVEVTATTGPVNIINITVDGTGGSNGCNGYLVGIYYGSGSSGTVNNATVRNEINAGCGYGIMAENGTATNETVTIENSSVHNFDYWGISADSNQSPPTLTATIKGNYVDGGLWGIVAYIDVSGAVTANVITGATFAGIASLSPVTISGNTVTSSSVGISTQVAGVSVTGNKISDSPYGIQLYASGATVKANTIARSSVGIEFNCLTGNTVSGNTINDAVTGFDQVPLSSTPSGTFLNVATIRTDGCGFARSHAKSLLGSFKHHPN